METEFVHARVIRQFPASSEWIFDAWLTQKLVATWMFGPAVRNEEIVSILLDPRVGGAFSFVVLRDGRRIDHIGRYLEIERPTRLSFTWGVKQGGADNSRVTIDIAARENGCELALVHQMPQQWADYVGRVEESWTKMLDVLASVVSENDVRSADSR
jgi:uncharacterized protein YndB with AHSA1/START domain